MSRLKRLGLFLGLPLLLLLAGIVFIASRLSPDEQVMSDIDRHFADLEKGSRGDSYYDEKNYGNSANDGGLVRVEHLPEKSPNGKTTKGSPGKKPQHRKRVARNEPAKPDPSPSAGPWPGIHRIAPGTYVIEKELVNSARKKPMSFVKGIRAKLSEIDGETVGYKLEGVKKKGAIYAAGLRNGDVLTAVNGYKLRTIDEAILAATALRFADKFRVDVLRGGRNRSFYYRMASE